METEEIQNSDTNIIVPNAGSGEEEDFEREGIAPTTSANGDAPTGDENISHEQGSDAESAVVASSAPRPATFTKVEKSLASLGFFTPSSRRIKNEKVKRVSFTRDVDGKRMEVTAEIHPSGMFGLPITADQDKYLALQEIITTKLHAEGKISNPIRFKSAELLRLLNNSTKTGKNYKAISEWLDVMSTTTIISDGAVYVAGQKRFARDRFRVFDRALSFGKEMDDGTVADANYIWLSAWQLENINQKFLLPIDLETYRELRNHIAKALVPLLQVWLFASHKAGSFEKRYEELCEILTLQTYRAPSHILRQFKPSLDELTHHGYIEKWRIEKTTDKKSYKIILFHGAKFHRDRRRRLEQKSRAETGVVVAESEPIEPNLPEPGKPDAVMVPDSPIQQHRAEVKTPDLAGVPGQLVDELSVRGLMPSVALKLLSSLSAARLDTVPDYIDYWDKVRKESDVRPGLLYDLIRNGEPLPADFETSQKRTDRLAAEEHKRNLAAAEARLKREYEDNCRLTIERFIAELPPGEFDRRVAEYRSQTANQSAFWNERPDVADQFARHAVRAEISKTVSLPAYDDFYTQRLPQVLAELTLDPVGPSVAPTEATTTPEEPPEGALRSLTGELPLQGHELHEPPLTREETGEEGREMKSLPQKEA